MDIAVTDANIFIDLIYLDLHHILPKIDLKIYTTHEVLGELYDEQQEALQLLISAGDLIVYNFSGDERDALEIFFISRKISPVDHSVIFLAEKMGATLLTGDEPVRKTCLERNLKAHGILWLFDLFFDNQLLTPISCAENLEKLMKKNSRLPRMECHSRLDRWKNN